MDVFLVTRRTLLTLVSAGGRVGRAREPPPRPLPPRADRALRGRAVPAGADRPLQRRVHAARGAAARRASPAAGARAGAAPGSARRAARRSGRAAVHPPARGGRLALRVPVLPGPAAAGLGRVPAPGERERHDPEPPQRRRLSRVGGLPAPADLRRSADAVPVPGHGDLRGRPGVPGPDGAGGPGRGVSPRVPARAEGARRRDVGVDRALPGLRARVRGRHDDPARERDGAARARGEVPAHRDRPVHAARPARRRSRAVARERRRGARAAERDLPGRGAHAHLRGRARARARRRRRRAAHRRRGDRALPRASRGVPAARGHAGHARKVRGGRGELRGRAGAARPRDLERPGLLPRGPALGLLLAGRPTRRCVPRAAARAREPVQRGGRLPGTRVAGELGARRRPPWRGEDPDRVRARQDACVGSRAAAQDLESRLKTLSATR